MTRPAWNSGEPRAGIPASGNCLIRKLSHFAPLSASDRDVLEALAAPEESFSADVDIVAEGMAPRSVFLILEGMAVRYRSLADGGRQIMTFLIPGDLCDIHVFLARTMDHSIGTITPTRITAISRERLMDVFALHPRISAALWWSSMQEEAMLRERIVSLGRRDARGRIAYILCELLWRHTAVGLTSNGTFQLPLTQTELGDTLGLTPVHVNRILKEFRSRNLISIDRKVIKLLDIQKLQETADFTKDYLQLEGVSEEVVRYFSGLEDRQRERSGRDIHGLERYE